MHMPLTLKYRCLSDNCDVSTARLKLRPYGAFQICLLLLLLVRMENHEHYAQRSAIYPLLYV